MRLRLPAASSALPMPERAGDAAVCAFDPSEIELYRRSALTCARIAPTDQFGVSYLEQLDDAIRRPERYPSRIPEDQGFGTWSGRLPMTNDTEARMRKVLMLIAALALARVDLGQDADDYRGGWRTDSGEAHTYEFSIRGT